MRPMTLYRERKAALRAELRARRDAFILDLPPGERERLERRAADRVMPILAGGTCVSGYIAIGSEFSCLPMLERAAAIGMRIALPYIAGRESPMRFLQWRPGESLECGHRGLWQPAIDSPEIFPDRILTPLLGFDSELWRIGQGAGFYDAAFAAMPAARRIGIGWSVQQANEIPRDSWDRPLHIMVTETIVIEGKDRG
jgi:5-formyltetrahydrofolate cyclo-ligase